jgi:hypothetical protein
MVPGIINVMKFIAEFLVALIESGQQKSSNFSHSINAIMTCTLVISVPQEGNYQLFVCKL